MRPISISRILTAVGVAAAAVLLQAAPAAAGGAQATVVSANPADFTPNVQNGAVRKAIQVGSTLYAGGNFTSVQKGATTFSRLNLFSFNATTGAVQTFTPNINGTVWALASNGAALY